MFNSPAAAKPAGTRAPESILIPLTSFPSTFEPPTAHSDMRLWTLHPRYLDPPGLVAAWREALLAQKVLSGGTRGYCNHPQLIRFRSHPKPSAAIAAFLDGLLAEAKTRGYRFDRSKIRHRTLKEPMDETHGQLMLEFHHLKLKLAARSPSHARHMESIAVPEPHPLFRIVPGGVRPWEKAILPTLS